MTTHPTFSIVIPCHNEATRINGLLGRVQRAFAGLAYECIVVVDGCSDDSEAVVHAVATSMSSMRILSQPTRLGKGGAIRRGMLEARGAYVGFIDGDDEIDPKFLREAFDLAQRGDVDMVIGNRHGKGAEYRTTLLRHITSWLYQAIIWALFALQLHDTQAGMKVFTADAAKKLFEASTVSEYAFDIDVLCHAHWMRYCIAELPIRQQFKGTSTITIRHTLQMLKDTCQTYDRHVREIVGRWARHESIGTLPVIRSFLFFPFTTIIAFSLGIFLRSKSR